MKLLKKINDKNINLDTKPRSDANERTRVAARAVLTDKNSKIALLYVKRENYYKLPGGGIGQNEEMLAGLKRELREETGCKAIIQGELGEIRERREKNLLNQISYCFLAQVDGEKSEPKFTDKEINHEFELHWLTLDKAIKAVENCLPTDYEGQFIKVRDLCFLQEYSKISKIADS